jgi:hypothetical protein
MSCPGSRRKPRSTAIVPDLSGGTRIWGHRPDGASIGPTCTASFTRPAGDPASRDAFKQDNPNFAYCKFFHACGLEISERVCVFYDFSCCFDGLLRLRIGQ